jgi:heme exporter protein D
MVVDSAPENDNSTTANSRSAEMGSAAADADLDVLFDLRVAIEHLYASLNDNPAFNINQAKHRLKELLGEGSGFIHSITRARAHQADIRAQKTRDDLLQYLRGLLDNFITKFAVEREKILQQLARRKARQDRGRS